MSDTVHVLPVDDLIAHESVGTGCVCGPSCEYVANPLGPDGWVITHHSLDGREVHEDD